MGSFVFQKWEKKLQRGKRIPRLIPDLCGSKIKRMSWIILVIAGLLEIAFASCLGKAKETTGTEAYLWYSGFFVAATLSMVLLLKATQHLPIGTAYAVWTGIGAVGTALMGILVFKDPANFWRIFFLVTLIGSIVGLKAVSH
jgi:quaternary ammonium compound-resistance protein SugE